MTKRDNFGDAVQIDVLVCTFRRASVAATLRSIDAQKVPDNFVIRVVVADNDVTPTASAIVRDTAANMKMPVSYLHAPALNISVARNATLDAADADWVAFIDDDEVASPDWLVSLYRAAVSGHFDAVFGPAVANYGEDAPYWIRARDYHSNRPQMRGRQVQTGHTCNALVRWRTSPFSTERFLTAKGRSGGEDTEFFFRLWRRGAVLGICAEAAVYEEVNPSRLTFDWISKRKFRAGQSYGRHAIAEKKSAQLGLAAAATAKVFGCTLMAALTAFSSERQRYWLLRGIFHSGVLSAQFGAKEQVLYGT